MPDYTETELMRATDAILTDRTPWEPLWRAVQDYVLPDGVRFNTQDVAGATNRDLIVSNYGENALEEAADGLISLACNPAQRWKSNAIAGLPDGAYAERVWLEDANDIDLALFANPRSRFTPAIKAYALEWLGFGTASMYVPARHGDIPLYEHRPLAEMACTEGESGFVEENVWCFEWPAYRAAQRWPKTCPEAILKAAADPEKRLNRFKFRHYVHPRAEYDESSYAARLRRWRGCWLAVDAKVLLDDEGFYSNPYVTGRLNKRGSWAYGRGRGVKALADIKMLQRVRRATIQGAEKTINPPIQAPDDGVNNGGDVDLRPGMQNFVRPEYLMRGAGIQPITTGARPDIGLDFETSVKEDIRTPFLNKALNIPAEPRMLVDQVMELKAQAMAAAGPIVGEFQTEVLGPLAMRTFDVLARAGVYPPPPPGIVANQRAIKAEFESPAARAQNLGIVSAIAQRNQVMLSIWQARPDLMDLVDWEATGRRIDRILGIPNDLSTPPETYRQMVEARHAVAAQREQLNAGKDMTTMVKNATPALKLAVDNTQSAANA